MSGVLIPFHKTAKKAEKEDFNARIEKVKASLEKINRLFAELNAIAETQPIKKDSDKP